MQDVPEEDAGVAETPQHLTGGSDRGHGHVDVQASGLAVRKRAALPLTGQASREGTGVKRHCSDTEKRKDALSQSLRKELPFRRERA